MNLSKEPMRVVCHDHAHDEIEYLRKNTAEDKDATITVTLNWEKCFHCQAEMRADYLLKRKHRSEPTDPNAPFDAIIPKSKVIEVNKP